MGTDRQPSTGPGRPPPQTDEPHGAPTDRGHAGPTRQSKTGTLPESLDRALPRCPMRLALLSTLALLAAGCTASRPAGDADGPGAEARDAQATATLSGRVTYLPRIALPPDAVLTVRLEDVSRADAAADVLTEHTEATAGRQVPLPFTLRYSPDSVQTRHRYVVRAEIRTDDGTLLWLSDTVHPVLTGGAPSDGVEVRVVQVDPAPSETGEAGAVTGAGALTGGTWRLVEIEGPGGRTDRPEPDQTFTVAFDADGRYSGQADCNRYAGTYEVGPGGALRTGQGAETLAACADPSLSDLFLRTLGRAQTATVSGDRLRVVGGGSTLTFRRAAESESD